MMNYIIECKWWTTYKKVISSRPVDSPILTHLLYQYSLRSFMMVVASAEQEESTNNGSNNSDNDNDNDNKNQTDKNMLMTMTTTISQNLR
mmetsp:Transcript_48382/g.53894  ORF Transcript_48382/g.53894 Transcript_48382/m.53894 type:complete len:90 (+) Transcript_48382:290-559(+)